MDILLVGAGGVFGSISRFALGQYIKSKNKWNFPAGTFIINITGAILLGIVTSFNSHSMYSLLGDGFLGAYTTFSTFMYEDVTLYKQNKKINAIVYITLSIILGIAGFIIGYKIRS
ncbi:MAG: crcB [Clostridiaceae bacterium]|jgi:CrcB protein|nr:crcB [Clostridiaceae bacterium]